VRSYNLRGLAIGGWVNRDCILDWIQITLRLDGATDFLVIFNRDSLNPGHIYLISIVRAFPSSVAVTTLGIAEDLIAKLNFLAPGL